MSRLTVSNHFAVFISRRRWLKRMASPLLPEIAKKRVFNKIDFHFDPRDMRGPSFHFAYDLEKGFNNYEEISKKELLELVPKKGVFLDVGANIGMFSVFFALNREDIRIYCFEPNSLAFTCLKKNLEPFKSREIKIFKKALGEIVEEKQLHKSTINDGGHSLIKENNLSEPERESAETVSVLNLDELVKNKVIPPPNTIKIDVEGFELDVVKGMTETIRSKKPSMLIESDNKDLAEKGDFWNLMVSFKTIGLFARKPGSSTRLSLEELSKVAREELEAGNPLSNYFFQFEN